MKAVILNASPRRGKTTDTLLSVFLSQFGGEYTIYNMYDEKISPCIACCSCEMTGECFMRDCDKIINDIFSCDYLIFASPIYCYSYPAPMKAFLDRLQPFYNDEKYFNPTFKRKGFVLATCGKSGKFSIDVIEKQSKIAFIELDASFDGVYLQTQTDKSEALQQEDICKVKNLAKNFFGQ